MFSIGKKLYDARGRETIINYIDDDKLHVTIITKSEVRYNNGMENEIQEYREDKTYSIDDLGIQLFFNKSDIGKEPGYLLDNSLYAFNRDNIKKHFNKKHDEIMAKIRSEAPDIPMSQLEKERIIKKYNSKEESAKEEKDFYDKNYRNQKYFARIDFDTEYYIPRYKEYHRGHYYERFYISKNVKAGNLENNIIDWRSEIGSLFYENRNTSIIKKDVGVFNSEVMLKRKFNFNPLSYKNLYIIGNDLYVEGSVDPFLLEVLEENRSSHRIGDIIKSIQSNQNKIIRQKPGINAIVQGCAGSGKTMILLHRLSYLKFNNYLSNMSKVKIITPNYLFTSYISDLSNTLELEEIEYITMDDYYTCSINKYMEDFNIELDKRKYKDLIQSTKEDSNLHRIDMYKYDKYFSTLYIEYIEEFYNNKLLEYKNAINSAKILEISDRMYQLKNAGYARTNNELLDYLYKLSNTELFRRDGELKQELDKCNSIIATTYSYLDTIAVHNHKILLLEKIINEKLLKLDALESLELDYVYDYMESTIDELLKYISKSIGLIGLMDTKPKTLIFIESKESKSLLYECFNIINNKLIDFKLRYSNKDFYGNKDVLEEYKTILEESQNICRSKSDVIKELREQYIDKLEENIENRYYISNLMLKDNEIHIIRSGKVSLLNRDEFIINTWLELLKEIDNSSSEKLTGKHRKIIGQFVLLNLLYLHYGPMISKDYFLFVDEGQDYSIEEYKLLNNINNGQVVFNIYGDVNQSLSSERKVENWDDLISIVGGNYYELNENYRNTVQVTKFCNSRFGYDHKPIGLEGPDVEYINPQDIEDIIDNILNKDTRTRIAVIQKNDNLFIDKLSRKYRKYKDSSMIIGDVGRVKGLEFDTVFVFTDDMSRNELYISYSRSLRKLYIIKSN